MVLRTAPAGIGYGIFQPPNNTDMMTAAPLRYNAAATCVLHTNRNVAQSFGSAVVSMTLLFAGASSTDLPAQASASRWALLVAFLGAGASVVAAMLKQCSASR